jgi:amino acid adenylation domain-containing protein
MELNVGAFRRAFQRLVDRHPILRSVFVENNDQLSMRVHDRQEVFFREVDVTGISSDALNAKLSEEMFRPFDLRRGPLLRANLYTRSKTDHICVLSTHHSVSDMWSYAIVMSEVSQLYTAEMTGKTASLRPLKTAYADHARAQAEMLRGPVGRDHLTFWRQYLHGELPILDLPIDKPRPPVQSDKGGSVFRRLDSTVTGKLKELASNHSTTLFNVVLAAYQVLLHRYTGQDDILVGTPKACRKASMARIIGYFVNPVVVRGDLSGDPPFTEFLERLNTVVNKAFDHEDLPFSLVVEKTQPARDLSHSPIFQALFSWQKTVQVVHKHRMASFAIGEAEGKGVRINELQMDPMPLPRRVVPFDISLLVAESDDGLVFTLEYSTDLFEEESVRRMLDNFHALLVEISSRPEERLSHLSMLTEAEQRNILSVWDRTSGKIEPAPCVHVQFEQEAARTPGSIALQMGDQEMTFEEVNEKANRLAHNLRSRGVAPETVVGLFLDRSPDAIVALLAILKSGGAYLPLDRAFPNERLAYLIEDAGAEVIITRDQMLEDLPSGIRSSALCLDRDWGTIALESAKNPVPAADRQNTAYVIYTSGSTGLPKGVMIPHEAIADHSRDMARYYEYTSADRVLQFASLNFDASLEQILCPLLAGARLVLRGEELWDPADFSRMAQEYGLTVINLPPAYWHQVATSLAEETETESLPTLRLTIIGGDVLAPETLRLWWRAGMGGVRLLNAYGPTETTITSMTYAIPSELRSGVSPVRVPIGSPLANRKALVLDRDARPVPTGVPGELFIGGMGLARGYLDRSALTAERFVPDPFSVLPGGRLYRTGDLVRIKPEGSIDFLRRADDQVKVRGFRVEPGEIESVLSEHQNVRQVVVVNRQDLPGDGRLIAYVVARSSPGPTSPELRSFARAKLPTFMIPSTFILLDAMPMTPGGKIDRRALPEPVSAEREEDHAHVSPRTPVEQELVGMWGEVLGVEKVGVTDNFFDLGGHSLLATQLVSRVRKTFHTEVSLKDLFDTPTVADVAVIIAQNLAGKETEEEMAKMLQELEGMTEKEVQGILNSEGTSLGPGQL